MYLLRCCSHNDKTQTSAGVTADIPTFLLLQRVGLLVVLPLMCVHVDLAFILFLKSQSLVFVQSYFYKQKPAKVKTAQVSLS